MDSLNILNKIDYEKKFLPQKSNYDIVWLISKFWLENEKQLLNIETKEIKVRLQQFIRNTWNTEPTVEEVGNIWGDGINLLESCKIIKKEKKWNNNFK